MIPSSANYKNSISVSFLSLVTFQSCLPSRSLRSHRDRRRREPRLIWPTHRTKLKRSNAGERWIFGKLLICEAVALLQSPKSLNLDLLGVPFTHPKRRRSKESLTLGWVAGVCLPRQLSVPPDDHGSVFRDGRHDSIRFSGPLSGTECRRVLQRAVGARDSETRDSEREIPVQEGEEVGAGS